MTEHIYRTVECDVSGETIDHYASMLTVETVGPSSPFLYGEQNYNRTLHISSEAHPFDPDRLDHDVRAFIANSGQVSLIEEDDGYRQMNYHSPDTDDEAIIELFDILQGIVDGWDV